MTYSRNGKNYNAHCLQGRDHLLLKDLPQGEHKSAELHPTWQIILFELILLIYENQLKAGVTG